MIVLNEIIVLCPRFERMINKTSKLEASPAGIVFRKDKASQGKSPLQKLEIGFFFKLKGEEGLKRLSRNMSESTNYLYDI